MKRLDPTVFILLTVLVTLASWGGAVDHRAAAAEEEPFCRAALAPAEVLIEAEASSLTVEFSRDPGPLAEVRAEEESGIEVIGFEVPEEALVGDLLAHLDLSAALPGSWQLDFEGTEGTCIALLTIGESKPA